MLPGDVAPVILSSFVVLVAGAVLIFRGAVGKAIARRIEGTIGESPELLDRLEFTERMLLTARDQPKELQ